VLYATIKSAALSHPESTDDMPFTLACHVDNQRALRFGGAAATKSFLILSFGSRTKSTIALCANDTRRRRVRSEGSRVCGSCAVPARGDHSSGSRPCHRCGPKSQIPMGDLRVPAAPRGLLPPTTIQSGRTVRVGLPMRFSGRLLGICGGPEQAHARLGTRSDHVYAIVNGRILSAGDPLYGGGAAETLSGTSRCPSERPATPIGSRP
jgi:hypothetical protein